MNQVGAILTCGQCNRPFQLLRSALHVMCPHCRSILALRPREVRVLAGSPQLAPILKIFGWAVVVIAGFKLLQGIADENFGDGEFPRWFREELIDEHIKSHGSWCPGCGRRVRRSDLTVDHVVAIANGGMTSRANARVLCFSCNSSKGARNTLLDHLFGR